ncbi:hypothetical protein Barb4_03948 [Bacteroidales bacterium Barb4]|nr:hypothetical protein Barb4_03948 [Bacteroidales bacterium Barb4]
MLAEVKDVHLRIPERFRADDGKGFALPGVKLFKVGTGKSPVGDKIETGRESEALQPPCVLQRILFNKENRVEYRIIMKGGRIKSLPFIRYLFDGIIVRLYV